MASSAVKFSPVRKFHLPTDLTTFSGLIQESLNSGTKIKKMNKKREYYFLEYIYVAIQWNTQYDKKRVYKEYTYIWKI